MASSLIDSDIFSNNYGTEEMRRVFDDENRLKKWLRVEVALALAEGKVGLIPPEAAKEIERKAKVEKLDFSEIRKGIQETGQVLMPVIWAVQNLCEGNTGQYFHWGPTSQDILDTGFVLQIKEALEIIFRDLRVCEERLLDMARRYRNTIIVGRTHGKQALPMTFGFKTAVCVREIRRNIERLKDCRTRLLVGQMSGGVGTFASFGEKGPEIQRLVMENLSLQMPDISWQPARDRTGELGCLLALIAYSFGRIGQEFFLLQKSELMEVEESFTYGKIGSSTMPHKRNPRLCEGIISLAKLIKGTALTTLESMWIDHDRDAKFMGIEWATISESLIMLSALLDKAKCLFANLVVDEKKMLHNLEASKGLILSEPVMFALANKIGRQNAHEVIYRISMEAVQKGIAFRNALIDDREFREYFTESDIEIILDPKGYLGLSGQIVDEILAMTKKEREKDDFI